MPDQGCPVCGYPDFAELHPCGGSTYDICPSCGFGSGVDGIGWDRETRNDTFRKRWIDGGAGWWSTARPPPPAWNAIEQLRAAGFIEDSAGDGEQEGEENA